MPRIVCARTDCKYNNDKNQCTAKDVKLSYHSVMTVWDGRQEFLKCKAYEMDDRSRELSEKLMEYMRNNPSEVSGKVP